MTDVSIPADVAKAMATFFRGDDDGPDHDGFGRWADLLDPKPPTLRQAVSDFLSAYGAGGPVADAVLAVIADEMAKRPLTAPGVQAVEQRDADVAWLRGESA